MQGIGRAGEKQSAATILKHRQLKVANLLKLQVALLLYIYQRNTTNEVNHTF